MAGLLVALFVALVGYLLFVASSVVGGGYEHTYRCVQFGVVEKAATSWGVRTSIWDSAPGQRCNP
jgi:hypothetical protein